VFANIAPSWRLARNLALLVVYYENRTDTSQPLTVVSPITQPIVFESFRDRGLFLTLRFDARARQCTAPLSGRPGDGAGRVSGIVYLDANDDGRLEAGEQGASNVTVILDGRYVTRTDAQGRFTFPSVIEGRHVVTVVPDNLPLPWVVKSDGRTELNEVEGTPPIEYVSVALF
jgi:SdrD B-like domain